MSVVRVRDMWWLIGIWIVVDLLMIEFGQSVPELLRYDGTKALPRDLYVVLYISLLWLFFAKRSALPSHAQKTGGDA